MACVYIPFTLNLIVCLPKFQYEYSYSLKKIINFNLNNYDLKLKIPQDQEKHFIIKSRKRILGV